MDATDIMVGQGFVVHDHPPTFYQRQPQGTERRPSQQGAIVASDPDAGHWIVIMGDDPSAAIVEAFDTDTEAAAFVRFVDALPCFPSQSGSMLEWLTNNDALLSLDPAITGVRALWEQYRLDGATAELGAPDTQAKEAIAPLSPSEIKAILAQYPRDPSEIAPLPEGVSESVIWYSGTKPRAAKTKIDVLEKTRELFQDEYMRRETIYEDLVDRGIDAVSAYDREKHGDSAALHKAMEDAQWHVAYYRTALNMIDEELGALKKPARKKKTTKKKAVRKNTVEPVAAEADAPANEDNPAGESYAEVIERVRREFPRELEQHIVAEYPTVEEIPDDQGSFDPDWVWDKGKPKTPKARLSRLQKKAQETRGNLQNAIEAYRALREQGLDTVYDHDIWLYVGSKNEDLVESAADALRGALMLRRNHVLYYKRALRATEAMLSKEEGEKVRVSSGTANTTAVGEDHPDLLRIKEIRRELATLELDDGGRYKALLHEEGELKDRLCNAEHDALKKRGVKYDDLGLTFGRSGRKPTGAPRLREIYCHGVEIAYLDGTERISKARVLEALTPALSPKEPAGQDTDKPLPDSVRKHQEEAAARAALPVPPVTVKPGEVASVGDVFESCVLRRRIDSINLAEKTVSIRLVASKKDGQWVATDKGIAHNFLISELNKQFGIEVDLPEYVSRAGNTPLSEWIPLTADELVVRAESPGNDVSYNGSIGGLGESWSDVIIHRAARNAPGKVLAIAGRLMTNPAQHAELVGVHPDKIAAYGSLLMRYAYSNMTPETLAAHMVNNNLLEPELRNTAAAFQRLQVRGDMTVEKLNQLNQAVNYHDFTTMARRHGSKAIGDIMEEWQKYGESHINKADDTPHSSRKSRPH
ncbi:hypothetical protein [Thiolapillus sp.]|uniref:hypothetical protein n=1 Tax=Thiolapillus sp. TaxID=2017437 RepID=UPI003AF44978